MLKRKNWSLKGELNEANNAYVREHADLIESITKGRGLNDLNNITDSTLTAIMGRMSAYSGKAVTWEQALNSKEKLGPAKLEWGKLETPLVAIPGQTEFV